MATHKHVWSYADRDENDNRTRVREVCRCGARRFGCKAKRLDDEGQQSWGPVGEWTYRVVEKDDSRERPAALGQHRWDLGAERCALCGLTEETLEEFGQEPRDFPCGGARLTGHFGSNSPMRAREGFPGRFPDPPSTTDPGTMLKGP